MKPRVVILGAGFGGLELSTILSEELGDRVDVALIDRNDSFVFGYAKLDVMFGRASPESVRLHYRDIAKPGVRFLQETVTAIDPEARIVTTDAGVHEADHLVVALGADYDLDATPGLAEGGHEFYSVAGAERVREILPDFAGGRVVVGVCGAPFKCPPAPSETCLLLHDFLTGHGRREASEIEFLMPLPSPVPPSPDTSAAILDAFAERDISFTPGARIESLDPDRRVVALKGGEEVSFDLFLGVPRHRAPDVVIESGLTVDGYIPVGPESLRTDRPGVYAVGDVTTVGVPKAGVFAEGAARVAARSIVAEIGGGDPPEPYDGLGSCYIEFGFGRVARVDVDFLSGPQPTGTFQAPSPELVAEKEHFGSSRRARWF